ncbi:MFS transporter [Cytobacillus purgationiresistens]|uniref:MFS family permease n=1 Tax=Cytobacillus purgationiresistens TaxID=863449 RepID=A0ABU0AC87_9BACI|nr:MFS transporter [Cytobacillus purgationiresistens]MDQ0268504.1 MFS family permease [Cytobacillus purgationiresistens]
MNTEAIGHQNKKETKSLWRNRNFLLIWGGSIISNFGFQLYTIAIPLLIYQISQSALAMSTMRMIEFFPNIFIGMIAGVLVDRYNRKKMMQWASFIQAMSMTFLVYLLIVDQVEIWHLYILGFALSASGYTFGNAQHAVLPEIVVKEQLINANAKFSFAQTIIGMIGPGVAGFIIAVFSFTYSFAIYTVCIFLMFLCMYFLSYHPHTSNTKEGSTIWIDMKEGIDELFQNKILLIPTITVLWVNFASSLIIGILIFYVVDQLGSSETEVGLMYSISAIGGLIGASIVGRLRKKFGRGEIYTFTLLIDVIGIICIIAATSWWLIGISLAIRTFAITISNIVYFTIRQEFTPNHLLGRVSGTSSMLMKITLPLGLMISGLWAEWLPIPILFIASAAIIFVLFIILLFHSFRQLD